MTQKLVELTQHQNEIPIKYLSQGDPENGQVLGNPGQYKIMCLLDLFEHITDVFCDLVHELNLTTP